MAEFRTFFHPNGDKILNCDRVLYTEGYIKPDEDGYEEYWQKVYFDNGETTDIFYNEHNMDKLSDIDALTGKKIRE